MDQRTSHVDIRGMSCANCSQTISDAVESLDGVSEANVNFDTEEGSVAYDPEAVSLGQIYDAIEEAGYTPVTDSVTIAITDMSCSTCSETVQDTLERTPGVVDADVNFATDEARVTYNPAEAHPGDLYEAIEDAGYSPVREDAETDGDSGVGTGEAA